MLKRTLTGAVILLITAAFILLKQFSALFFDAFVLIVAYASLFEVIKAYKIANKKPHTLALAFVPALIWISFSASRKMFAGMPSKVIFGGIIGAIIVAAFALMLFLTIDIIKAKINRKEEISEEDLTDNFAFESSKISMQIIAYPLLPISFFFALNSLPYDLSYIGIILTFAIAMMTDTFAYLFGKFFGKTKFIPEVSPKKTVAGVVGGFVGGLIAAAAVFAFAYFSPYFALFRQIELLNSIGAFAIIAIFGSYINQLGDLIASSLKRKVGLKDYSNIFPGHGGFMDRVDGQMFVAVWVLLVLVFFFV